MPILPVPERGTVASIRVLASGAVAPARERDQHCTQDEQDDTGDGVQPHITVAHGQTAQRRLCKHKRRNERTELHHLITARPPLRAAAWHVEGPGHRPGPSMMAPLVKLRVVLRVLVDHDWSCPNASPVSTDVATGSAGLISLSP